MLLIGRFHCLFVLAACLLGSSVFAAVPNLTEPTPQIITAKIKLDERSMIIVPVRINGSGPYDFLLDTGCSKTMVDQTLANQLGLPRVGQSTVLGVQATTEMPVVRVNSLSVNGATVFGGELLSPERPATVAGQVQGVLGEDFLRNFDLLIDYRDRQVRLESASGTMAETAAGERLSLQLTATYRGKPTHNQLVVSGRIQEFGDTPLSLLLDSGANQLTLFKEDLGPGESQTESIGTASFGQWTTASAAIRRIHSLNLGGHSLPDLTLIALSRRAGASVDGLIPTALFHSVFISHLGRFVILNPSFPKDGRHEPEVPGTR